MPTHELAALKSSTERILSNPTWDIVTVLALFAIGFFYGLFAGKWRIAATILYTYMTFAIFLALPIEAWLANFHFARAFAVKIFTFVGLLAFFALMLGSRPRRSLAAVRAWWQIFLLSFLQAGLLIHIILTFFPKDKVDQLAPLTRTLFANPSLHIWWLVTPIVALIILRRFDRREY